MENIGLRAIVVKYLDIAEQALTHTYEHFMEDCSQEETEELDRVRVQLQALIITMENED